ncbi:MAG: bifunctional (p)ppGpp synthetase/guanosine-3',5'-bis(diphosphate) 3'-pyrophosphohydrolase [Ectothiorhodospiraceae bacterium AqS1]|nr:bifunctional (p)ppGpp synthetase/guanosine-3',5'-bis(diphosphate) 3'-pyrophosphohydrolase [Ectothiorhodospiraceae bacterium AqS1]
MAGKYLSPAQVEEIRRAIRFGRRAHKGQQRASGEDYIVHPVQVATILAGMRLDRETIVAAILHDVIEDTPTVKDQIVAEFGNEVAELVDGVSKLTHLSRENRALAQAENFRKILMAMSRDIRVILIKLTDRLHNMRTIDPLPIEKQHRIARETLDIYAPIANRLGLRGIWMELEDLCFRALHPWRYRIIASHVKKMQGNRRRDLQHVEKEIRRQLRRGFILKAHIERRERHLYDFYRKMRTKRIPLEKIRYDYGIKIIVELPDDCYRALGVVHRLYKPVPGKFKDFIAIPKANGYQSLHTVLFGPLDAPIDIQIRTNEMNRVAEAGIAAHWTYKTGKPATNAAQRRIRKWVRDLLEMQSHAGDSMEFLESVKEDLFPKEIYIFTPSGETVVLPRGATVIDYAYSIHTDIGNHCIGAKLGGHYISLQRQLFNGDTIEIIKADWGRPNASWLDFATTGKARSAIRSYLKNLQGEEAIAIGKQLLERALAAESMRFDEIPQASLAALLEEFRLDGIEELHKAIGIGERLAPLVARRLLAGESAGAAEPEKATLLSRKTAPLYIRGSDGMVVDLGRCCRPIPGDAVIGILSAGRGLTIHTMNCPRAAEYSNEPERWVEVAWEPGVEGDFPVEIRVDMANRAGVLATVASVIADMNSNIDNIDFKSRDGLNSTLNFLLEVRDRAHLEKIIHRIRSIGDVSRTIRI